MCNNYQQIDTTEGKRKRHHCNFCDKVAELNLCKKSEVILITGTDFKKCLNKKKLRKLKDIRRAILHPQSSKKVRLFRYQPFLKLNCKRQNVYYIIFLF